jgi:hypothetical protein
MTAETGIRTRYLVFHTLVKLLDALSRTMDLTIVSGTCYVMCKPGSSLPPNRW